MVVLKKQWRILAIILVLMGGWLFIWASIPIMHETEVRVLEPSMMRMEKKGEQNSAAILVDRRVRLKWPRSMRIGEEATIQLGFEEAGGESPSSADHAVLEDAYKNYNLMGEARFEAAGLILEPANPTRESMPRGRPIKFKWEIRSDKTGWFEGTVWLSLRFLPLDGSAPIQVPIYIREVMLHSTSVLGLSGPVARIVGGVGMVMGLVLVMGNILTRRARRTQMTQIIKYIWQKRYDGNVIKLGGIHK